MDHADDNYDGDIYIYRGGRVPRHVTHALIDESADEIEEEAFQFCNVVQVDTHDGLRKVGRYAFGGCKSLRRINLKSAVDIISGAFSCCKNLESVEFGDRLETIGRTALGDCQSLSSLKLSCITTGPTTFTRCTGLTDVEFSERLETIGERAFWQCPRLQRIAIPLKRDLFQFSDYWQNYNQFEDCEQLVKVDLVGNAHTRTVASLHMDSWRTEMTVEINRINQVLPNTPADGKTSEIQQWMESTIVKMDHYKAEHWRYVKEGITLLELALWKSKLGEKEDNCEAEGSAEKVKLDEESARKERRITCGADMVIKNVLPFLKLDE